MAGKYNKPSDPNHLRREETMFASLLDEAHRYITTGVLMRLGFRIFRTVRGGGYALIINAYEDFDNHPHKTVLLRAATRTMRQSLSFTGGVRGGVNRHYKSGVKVYKYTEKHNDLIIGVDGESLDLYIVPTRHIANWGTSRSKTKLQAYRHNWDILLHWNDEFLKQVEAQGEG